MTTLVQWSPSTEIARMSRTMDRLLHDQHLVHYRPFSFDWGLDPFWYEGMIPVDLYENKDAFVVKASLPGVKSGDVDISVTGDTLTIKAEIKEEEKAKEEDFVCRERRYGSFTRSIELPGSVLADKAEAHFEDGVLTLSIPKSEELKPKHIKLTTGKVIEGKK